MATLLNAAKYLVKEYGFSPVYTDEPMFEDPIVPAAQRETFETIHLLSCVANGTDVTLMSVRRVTDWLSRKTQAANA